MNPATLTQNTPASVTFTLMQGGSAVGAGKSVTFTANANFNNLPATAQTTDGSGQFTVSSLTALASGNQTLSATVEGQAVMLSVHVDPLPYTLEASPSTLTQNTPGNVIFTLKLGSMPVSNKTVSFAPGVRDNSDFDNLPATSTATDGSGQFTVTNLKATAYGALTMEGTVDTQAVTVTVNVTEAGFQLQAAAGSPSVGGFNAGSATATITVQLLRDGAPHTTATPVTWSVDSAANSGPVVSGYGNKKTGLAWGTTAATPPETELTSTTTSNTSTSDGTASIQLTDVMGQRTVAVQAKVTIGADYTVTQNVTFGDGPLADFAGPLAPSVTIWLNAVDSCGGDSSTINTTIPGYKTDSYLPQVATLQNVAKGSGKGAAYAAGWDTVAVNYWTGEIATAGRAHYVVLSSGIGIYSENTGYGSEGAVCVPGVPGP
jgi:hypothetical protein